MPGARRSAGPARRWGWHPLTPEWAARVVEQSPVRPGDLVVDLGAGNGELTEALVRAGADVLAVELHPRRASVLRERLGDDVRVLEIDLADLRLPHRPFRVVANPPWALAVGTVRHLLGSDRLRSADLVLPRGVTGRLVERPPSARHARRVRASTGPTVPRAAFRPPPRVDARVLRLRR